MKRYTIYSTGLTLAVCVCTTAIAVQRIPDAKCNGDMTKALEFVKKFKANKKIF